jgi:hypothetical protein
MLISPIGQAGKGTCEKRMTLRNWRLVSQDVGPKGINGKDEVEEGWIHSCDWPQRRRGAEWQNHLIGSMLFFFWLLEKFVSTTWKPEFGELMRCCSGDRGFG